MQALGKDVGGWAEGSVALCGRVVVHVLTQFIVGEGVGHPLRVNHLQKALVAGHGREGGVRHAAVVVVVCRWVGGWVVMKRFRRLGEVDCRPTSPCLFSGQKEWQTSWREKIRTPMQGKRDKTAKTRTKNGTANEKEDEKRRGGKHCSTAAIAHNHHP